MGVVRGAGPWKLPCFLEFLVVLCQCALQAKGVCLWMSGWALAAMGLCLDSCSAVSLPRRLRCRHRPQQCGILHSRAAYECSLQSICSRCTWSTVDRTSWVCWGLCSSIVRHIPLAFCCMVGCMSGQPVGFCPAMSGVCRWHRAAVYNSRMYRQYGTSCEAVHGIL